MLTFSERFGYTPIRIAIQRESIDDTLRTELWNFIYQVYLGELNDDSKITERVWTDYFKKRIDEYDDSEAVFLVKETFTKGKWNQVYDLLEIIPKFHLKNSKSRVFYVKILGIINNILKNNLAAYRIVDGILVEITSEEEIKEIEEVLNEPTSRFTPVKNHIKRSLELFSDRLAPDFRNSIKESISAVEALSTILTETPNATLVNALKLIEDRYELHAALKGAFVKLYGYTSDAEGIRHALLDEPTLKQEDAKFMLVACSAFVNYLIAKSNLE